MITNKRFEDHDPEDLINLEISVRKLTTHISKGQMEDAFKYVLEMKCTYIHHQSLTWYKCVYDCLTETKECINLEPSFWIFLMIVSERYVALLLAEFEDKAKNAETTQVLLNFDQVLYEADSRIKCAQHTNKAQKLFDHMYGQFNYHLGCLWLRSAKTETTTWRETVRLCCPLFLTAIYLTVIDLDVNWGISMTKDQASLWHKESSYRCSQASHVLAEYGGYRFRESMDEISEFMTDSWREETFRKIFANRYNEELIKTSYFVNNSTGNPPVNLLVLAGSQEFDEAAKQIYPDSLHPEIIDHIIPHCRFLKPADRYILRDLVIKFGPNYKDLLHSCVNVRDKILVARDFSYNAAKLLLEQGAHIHIQTPNNSLVFEAIENGCPEIAQLFLDYNADVQYISPDGDTLLHKAIERRFDERFIKTLLKLNLPVNTKNCHGLTPLLLACQIQLKTPLEIIKALLHYNADINCTDNHLTTPLHFACQAGNLELVTVLLQNGANPNATIRFGQTPLHFVCRYKSDMTANMIQLLLQYNANIEAVDRGNRTPLFVACCFCNVVAVKYLLNHHSDTEDTDLKNLTAASSSTSKVVNMLLEHEANVHCINTSGMSLIHVAVRQENVEIIKILAHTQVNFNSVNKRGDTPLHVAIEERFVEMTNCLIKYGANVNILDRKNRTPLKKAFDIMRSYEHSDSWKIFKVITNILIIQVVKLKAAGFKVHNYNLNIIYNSNYDITKYFGCSDEEDSICNIKELELNCEQEIEKMKKESIGIDKITFYDFLKRNIYFLCRFFKFEKIQQILELGIYDKKFPLYINIVRNRFRKTKIRYRRRILMSSARELFNVNISSLLPDECIDAVFNYFSIEELKMFIKTMELLNA